MLRFYPPSHQGSSAAINTAQVCHLCPALRQCLLLVGNGPADPLLDGPDVVRDAEPQYEELTRRTEGPNQDQPVSNPVTPAFRAATWRMVGVVYVSRRGGLLPDYPDDHRAECRSLVYLR